MHFCKNLDTLLQAAGICQGNEAAANALCVRIHAHFLAEEPFFMSPKSILYMLSILD